MLIETKSYEKDILDDSLDISKEIFFYEKGLKRQGKKRNKSWFVKKDSTLRYASMFGDEQANIRFKNYEKPEEEIDLDFNLPSGLLTKSFDELKEHRQKAFIQRTSWLNKKQKKVYESHYPEWNFKENELIKDVCPLVFGKLNTSKNSFYDDVLTKYDYEIGKIRDEFEKLRPDDKRFEKAQIQGEEIDLEKAIDFMVSYRSGSLPDENVFLENQRKERSVATGILLDVSGSTSGNEINMIKKTSVFLSEAFDAIGDNYSIYSYTTSRMSNADDLLLTKISDFGEELSLESKYAIGNLCPLNHDPTGPAIRFMCDKLENTSEKYKLLFVITDGVPCYTGDGYRKHNKYGANDIRNAFIDSKLRGINTFGINISGGNERIFNKMYGANNHIYINNVSSLPSKMVDIYKKFTF